MLSIDHVVMAVADLDAAGERWWAEHGLASLPGGVHPRWGTANRVVPLGDHYLELLAVVDPDVASTTVLGTTLLDLTADGSDRWLSICLADSELDSTAARLGLEVESGGRRRTDGVEIHWRSAGLDDPKRDPYLPFFIAWEVPLELHPARMPVDHPVAAAGISSVEVAGDGDRLREWLGPAGSRLPIRLVDSRPGVRAVEVARRGGGTIRITG